MFEKYWNKKKSLPC
uniref:Uncharacterized protein n=1 Tax=Arundo donax TaxID=35708 RepID=A0A0A9BBA7_ARUDO